MTPPGALSVSWALCMAQLHRTRLFPAVYLAVRLLVITAVIVHGLALMIPLITLVQEATSPVALSLLQVLVFGLALSAIFFIDHIHTLVLANLVGMATPTSTRHGAEARWQAVLTFVGLQLIGYVTASALALLIFPAAFLVFQINGWLAHVALAMLAVAGFAIIGEITIVGYGRYVAYQLNTDTGDFAN